MASIARYATITNNTGAFLTIAGAKAQYADKDGGVKFFTRQFSAIDVGNAPGKTQDPAGCIIASPNGLKVKGILSLQLWRPNGNVAPIINYLVSATAAGFVSLGTYVGTDGQTCYIQDSGTNAATRITAGDYITFGLILANY